MIKTEEKPYTEMKCPDCKGDLVQIGTVDDHPSELVVHCKKCSHIYYAKYDAGVKGVVLSWHGINIPLKKSKYLSSKGGSTI